MSREEKEKGKSISITQVTYIIANSIIGYLYPERDRELTEADSFDKLKEAVKNTPYEQMLLSVTDIPNKEKASEFSSAGKSIGKLIYID